VLVVLVLKFAFVLDNRSECVAKRRAMERRHKEGANQGSRPVPPQQLLRACVHAPTVAACMHACMLHHRSAVIISKF
jgi:hypothetical protein